MRGKITMTDETKLDEIRGQIIDILHPQIRAAKTAGDPDFETIITALRDVLTFEMSLLCPVCRKRFAVQFKRRIPLMVIEANQMAAEAGHDPSCSLH
jgi:hypothetical protein